MVKVFKAIIWGTVLFCSGYFYATTTTGSRISLVLLVVSFCLMLTSTVLMETNTANRRLHFKKNEFCIIILMIDAILISELLNGNVMSFSSIKQIMLTLCAFLIYKYTKYEDFKRIFVKSMAGIMVLAIIGYIIFQTPFFELFPIVENYNGEQYLNGVVFTTLRYTYSGISQRMQGLFWEPGLFSTYLSLALLYVEPDYFKTKKSYYLFAFLCILCIILTMSGAGLILLPLVLVFKLTSMKNLNRVRSSTTLSLLIIVVTAVLFVIFINMSSVADSWLERFLFSKIDSNSISNYSRVNAMIVDMKLFFDTFPLGTGITNYASAIAQYSSILVSAGTSTVTNYLAQYGLLGFVFVGEWLHGFIKLKKSYNIATWCVYVVIFVMILTKEPHGNLLFANCILMYFSFENIDEK